LFDREKFLPSPLFVFIEKDLAASELQGLSVLVDKEKECDFESSSFY
jgi:hypothetical protein